MFEISQLKEKKLPELQEIAKELNVPKFSSLKKIDLVCSFRIFINLLTVFSFCFIIIIC